MDNEKLRGFYNKGAGSSYRHDTGCINYDAVEDFAINEVPVNVITAEVGLTGTFGGTAAVFILSCVVSRDRDLFALCITH